MQKLCQVRYKDFSTCPALEVGVADGYERALLGVLSDRLLVHCSRCQGVMCGWISVLSVDGAQVNSFIDWCAVLGHHTCFESSAPTL